MIFCYILFSHHLDKFYIGANREGLDRRIEKHNSDFYGESKYSASAVDWTLFLAIPCQTFSQAVNIERHIKRMKSRVYILNLKKYPELVEKLLKKYSNRCLK